MKRHLNIYDYLFLLLFGFIFVFKNISVYAETMTPNYAQFGVDYYNCNVHLGNCYLYNELGAVGIGNAPGYGFVNVGNSITLSQDSFIGVLRYKIWSDNTGFVSGNTYNIRFIMQTSNKNWLNEIGMSKLISGSSFARVQGSTNTAPGDSVFLSLTPVLSGNDLPSSPYAFVLTISFTPTTTLKFIEFDVQFGYIDSGRWLHSPTISGIQDINIESGGLSITYSTGVGSNIDNQTNVIINQTNDINNSINDLNDSLNDDEIDDNTSGYLDDLTDSYSSTALTPFSSFITLPLTWIQSLLASNQNCSPLVLPLPFIDSDLTLPCMSSFWSKLGLLGNLVQVVWIAIVGIRIFNGLYLIVVEVKNPNPEEDMDKLKTWEV